MIKKTDSEHFAEFCWHKGKCWFNPKNPLNNRGEISLWSVKNDGSGIQAALSEVYDCTEKEIDAIKAFQGRTRSPELTKICQCLDKHITHWDNSPQGDPHGISTAVSVTLTAVKLAIEEANKY